MQRIILPILLLFLSTNLLFADTEPNNNIASANPIPLGSFHTGTLTTTTDNDDYYKLTTPKNGRLLISLNTSTSALNARIYFYNHAGTYITNSSTGDSVKIEYNCYSEGDLYVRVNRASADGAYLLRVEHDPISLANDPGEPGNNSLATANNLPPNTIETGHLGYLNGAIAPQDNDDYYVTVLPANGKITAKVFPTNGLSCRIYFYNAAGTYLTNTAASSDSVVLNYDCLLSDTLYYRVNRAGSCGSYSIFWTYESTNYGPDAEPNNNFASALPINEDIAATGNMGYVNASSPDNDDYYAVYLPKDGKIDISLNTFESLTGRIYIYNKAKTYLTNSAAGTNVTLSYDCLLSDSVFIRVNRSGGCGSYDLTYSLTGSTYSDDNEPNNSIADALSLNMNSLRQGHLGYVNASSPDNNDYYVVDSEAPGDLTFTATFEESLSGIIYLYSETGAYITNSPASGDSISLTYNAPADALYYVRITRSGSCGSYTIKAENGCPKPKNLRTDPAISIGAILKWNSVAAADKYRLQKRVVGAPSWEPNLNVNIPKYIWYPLDECTDYEFRVEARCGDRNSSFTPIEQFQTLCEPICFTPTSVFVNTTTTTTAQIGWAGQPIDVGYRVQYVVDGDFSTIFEKTSSAPMVELTGLAPGTNYLFRVNAFCLGGGISGYSLGSFATNTLRTAEESGFTPKVLELFPNPTSTSVRISLETADNRIEITNAVGQIVLVKEAMGSNPVLDISNLEPGIYQVRATTANSSEVYASSLIVQ